MSVVWPQSFFIQKKFLSLGSISGRGHYFLSIAHLFGRDVTAVQYAGSLYGLDIA
jgi:hypothetical protein